jgi:hypothetical protein
MGFTTNFYIELGDGMVATEALLSIGSVILITINKNGQKIKARLDLKQRIFIDYPFENVDKVAVDNIVKHIKGE